MAASVSIYRRFQGNGGSRKLDTSALGVLAEITGQYRRSVDE